jgi:hypothetical protein
MVLDKQTPKPEIESYMHYKVEELFDQLLNSLGEGPEGLTVEIMGFQTDEAGQTVPYVKNVLKFPNGVR